MSHGCGRPADMAGPPDDGGGNGGGVTPGGGGGAPLCPYQGPPLFDANQLPSCAPACGAAHCVPKELVPPAQQAQLAACPFDGKPGLCAPDVMTTSGNLYVPPSCRSVAGAEGRCLSTCIANVAAQAALLPEAGCPRDTRCAPCFDPTAADPTAPTGACSLACDAPKEPPLVLTCPWTGPDVLDPQKLPACSPACGGAHCVPAARVPPAQRAQLAPCPGGYCTPDPIVRAGGAYKPPTCSPFSGTPAEGRCQSQCLPPIAAQASQLHQRSCAGGELCAPCYDPFSGAATGACSATACDRPTQPAYTFPACCHGDEGTCVPTENIPPAQQSHLQQLDCPAQLACVPKEMLPGRSPETCTALLLPGVCLSDCLAGVPPLPQGTCPVHHACIPCALAPAGTPGC
jgi:hypothetical protein